MPNPESKPDFVRENFNRIAVKYDLFNDWNSFFLHRAWKNQLVRELATHSPSRVLDLCSGTGDIALRIAKIPGVEALYSVDFSKDMLQVAQVRFQSLPANLQDKITVQVGDAMDLRDFADDSLDAVSIGFGLRNVRDLRACLREIIRVLRPGGIYLNLDVGKVKNPIIRWFADFYFFRVVPIFGYILWGGKNEMFDYLPVSSLSYPGQEELSGILREEGFQSVRYRDFVFGNATLHFAQKPRSESEPK